MAEENNDQNNNNQQNNDQNNQNSNNTTQTVVIACDTNNGNDSMVQDTVAKACEAAGYKVEKLPIGPNEYATYSYSGQASGKKGVYLMAASLLSFLDAAQAGFDYNVLGIRGDVTEWSDEEWKTKKIPKDHHGDCTMPECDKYEGKTYPELNEIYKGKCVAVPGETPEKLAQNVVQALGGQYAGTGTTSSGGGAQIKDKTFEKCIRRICAATDSVFLVENNAAVLFPYTDWLAFTLKEKIQTITPKEIDPDVFSMEYNNQGFYNKVSIAWGDAVLPERFPDNPIMHKKYVEHVKEVKELRKQQAEERLKQQESETTIKKHGTTQKIKQTEDGSVLSEQYDALVEQYGELEKRIESPVQDLETAQYLVNALLIQYVRDFNNVCQCRSLANRKYLGGTFYTVTNPFTYKKEMFYLNGYTVRTQRDQPIYFDLDFRYGPESAEELLDYQFYTGGAAAGGSGMTGGEAANINELAKLAAGGATDPLKKAQNIHEYLRQYIKYSGYSCSQEKWGKDASKIWEDVKKGEGTNCADTANLTRAVMSAAGLQAEVVHDGTGCGHFWTVIIINGKEYTSDLVGSEGQHSVRPFNEVWEGRNYQEKCGKTACC